MYHDELKKGNARTKYFFFWIYTVAFMNTKETTCTHTLYLENKLKMRRNSYLSYIPKLFIEKQECSITFTNDIGRFTLYCLSLNFSTDMFYTSWWWNESSFSSKDLKKYFFSVLECNKHAYITWYIDLWP